MWQPGRGGSVHSGSDRLWPTSGNYLVAVFEQKFNRGRIHIMIHSNSV